MARGVQYLELERPDAIGLTIFKAHDVVDLRGDRAKLSPQRLPLGNHVPLGVVHGDRHGAECLPQLVESRDVIEVGVREEDRLHCGAARACDLDDQLGLQVGVDDSGVVRVLVLDKVRVRGEPSVGGDLDVDRHKVLRTIRCRSVSR